MREKVEMKGGVAKTIPRQTMLRVNGQQPRGAKGQQALEQWCLSEQVEAPP